MENKILRWCRQQALFSPGETVFCAVSGGADSVAMLHVLLRLQEALQIRVEAAHFNHRLRGDESDRDEAFVRALCQQLEVSLRVGSADVAAYAAASGRSIEEAARVLRYEFLDALPGKVATAHTADDNLETTLLNLLRGTALRGLCGVPPRRGRIVRPMLCVTRHEIENYLQENALSHVEDSTNGEDDCVRNRLRHHVLPLLRAENPSMAAAWQKNAVLLREDEDYLQAIADDALQNAAAPEGGYFVQALRQLPGPVRGRAVRAMLRRIEAPKLSAPHLEAVEALLETASPSACCSLPGGWEARRCYDRIELVRERPAALERTPVARDGITDAAGFRITCAPAVRPVGAFRDARMFYCRADVCELCLRSRQEGDRIRLHGGSRSLKKLLIDRKIPAALRDQIPVLGCSCGVLWVEGFGWNPELEAGEQENAILITIEKEEKNYDQ